MELVDYYIIPELAIVMVASWQDSFCTGAISQ